jgi:hypothetical protein
MLERTSNRVNQMSQSKVVTLTPWDMLTRSTAQRSRAHAILDSKDADQAIRSLSPLESYYTMKALGPHDAIPYLAVIEEEQITSLFDLEVWGRDRLEIPDLMIWFDAFREAGLDRLQLAARNLDSETLALLFNRRLLIALVTEDDVEDPPDWVQNPSPDITPVVMTPDNRFYIAARSVDESNELEGGDQALDEEDRKAIIQLVDDLYRDVDFEFVSSVLRLAESGLSSCFEEESFRFRNARLEDLGFPPFARAIEIFSIVDIDQVLNSSLSAERNSGNMRLPALHVESVSDGYFVELMLTIEDPVLVRTVEAELVPLANAMLVAERIEINNLEAVRECLNLARHYLELALTYNNDGTQRFLESTRRLANHDLKTLFRVGYTLAVKMKARCKVINRALVDESDRELLEAIGQRRPRMLDREALESLLKAWEMAADIDLSVITGEVYPPAQEQTIDLLVNTLAARILLFDVKELEAFSAEELKQLVDKTSGDAFLPEDVNRVLARFEGVWRTRVQAGLAALGLELSALLSEDVIDVRFVSGVVCRSDH